MDLRFSVLGVGLAFAWLAGPSMAVGGDLLNENFETLALQPAVDENIDPSILGFTHDTPTSWSITNQNPPHTGIGCVEWDGWSFTTKAFWTSAATQGREAFTISPEGIFAVADSDEYDDCRGGGPFDSTLHSPRINVAAGQITFVTFDSDFRAEGNEKADLFVSFDDGPDQLLLRRDVGTGDRRNEAVQVQIPAPATDSTMVLKWRLHDGSNNWWWAIDNVVVFGLTGDETPPDTPVNIAPIDGATAGPAPLLESSVFIDGDAGDRLRATRWQVIEQGGDFQNPLYDSQEVLGDATGHALPGGILQIDMTYFWRARYQDFFLLWSEWSAPTSFFTEGVAPTAPTNVSPAEGAAIGPAPRLEASAFADADEGDELTGTQWQVIEEGGDFNAPFYDSGDVNSSETSHAMPGGILNILTTYRWRVRYKDLFGLWSEWSNPTSMTTGGIAPDTPTNLQPVNDEFVGPTPRLDGSSFMDADEGDALVATQWQIDASGANFEAPIHDSGEIASDQPTYNVPSGVLAMGQIFQWRVRYKDLFDLWSDWSTPTTFSSMLPPPGAMAFTNIAQVSGITSVGGRAGGWADFDNDGWQDLWTGRELFHNENGSGIFTKTADLGAAGAGGSWADYDNDGDLDLFSGSRTLSENMDGSGTFVNANVPGQSSFASQSVCWADYDLDGWVDVYVVGDVGAPGALYRNLQGTGFENVTAALGIEDPLEGYGGSWGDYDNDGDLDLVIGNCRNTVGPEPPQDRFFENLGGTFIERGEEVGVFTSFNSWCPAWGDYDNDGDLDLYMVTSSGGQDHFYRNDGTSFTNISGPNTPDGVQRDAQWADFDNDGDVDLLLPQNGGSHLLWINNDNGTFTEKAAEMGISGTGTVGSVADFDNDGDLDIFFGGGQYGLFRNELTGSNWLILRLEGTTANRSAVGARVEVTAVGVKQPGVELTQIREVQAGNGLYTSAMLPVHFGLGDATEIKSVTIRWPAAGVQTFFNIQANRISAVVEGQNQVEAIWAEYP